MKNFLLSKKETITIAVAGLTSVLMVAGMVYATTISTDISTGGALSVSGASTLSSATLSGTLSVTGLSTFGTSGFVSQASSTVVGRLEVDGNLVSAHGKVGAGTTTPAAELSATGSATTSLYLDTSGTKVGSCIELLSSTSTVWRMYIGASDTNDIVAVSGPRGSSTVVALWERGSCK